MALLMRIIFSPAASLARAGLGGSGRSGWSGAAPGGSGNHRAARRRSGAVFLLNLTRFVRWPDAAFKTEDAPLVVGTMEGDPVGNSLEEAVQGEKVGKHPIQTRRVRSPADLEGCQVVYFAREYFPGAAQMLAPLKDKPILTVSDADSFLTLGGHIQFYNQTGARSGSGSACPTSSAPTWRPVPSFCAWRKRGDAFGRAVDRGL